MNIITESFTGSLNTIFMMISSYVPKLIAGILLMLIGLVIASIVRDGIYLLFRYVRIDRWMESAGVVKQSEISMWPKIVAELSRWVIIFIFLMSAVEVWGVPKVADVLNQLLSFLPNVLVAVIIGWVGMVAARFAFDIVRHGVGGVEAKEEIILGNIARYAILFFTALVILTQLGVAAELVKILFTGIVAMIAGAFALAFGLGGRDEAAEILKKLRVKLEGQTKQKRK